jgi:two-component system, NarL family, nitrate/nitrite response regulator NarL
VTVQAIGDPGTPRPPVAHAVLAAVDAVLSALTPQPVTLTVLAAGEDVELYLTFSAPVRAVTDLARLGRDVPAAARWISPRLAYIFATDDTVGRPTLSHQERRALQLYATGLPMKSVAKKMAISEETVKQYLGRVRQKYIVAGRAAPTKLELYHRAVEDGHLPPTP